MDHKSSVGLLALVGIALILGSVSMVSQSGVKIAVSKPYSEAQTSPQTSASILLDDHIYCRSIGGSCASGSKTGICAPPKENLGQSCTRVLEACPKGSPVYTQCVSKTILSTEGIKFDVNKDGKLDNRDVGIVNSSVTQGAYNPLYDFTGDKRVTGDDIRAMRNYMQNSGIPEAVYYDLTLDGKVDNKDVKLIADGVAVKSTNQYLNISFNRFSQSVGGAVQDPTIVNAEDVFAVRKYMQNSRVSNAVYYDLTLPVGFDATDVSLVVNGVNARSTNLYLDVNNNRVVDKGDETQIRNAHLNP